MSDSSSSTAAARNKSLPSSLTARLSAFGFLKGDAAESKADNLPADDDKNTYNLLSAAPEPSSFEEHVEFDSESGFQVPIAANRGRTDSGGMSSFGLWQKQQFIQQIAKVTAEKNAALQQMHKLEEALLLNSREIDNLKKQLLDEKATSEDHLGNIQLKSLMVKELAGMIQEKDAHIGKLNKEISEINSELKSKSRRVEELEASEKELKNKLLMFGDKLHLAEKQLDAVNKLQLGTSPAGETESKVEEETSDSIQESSSSTVSSLALKIVQLQELANAREEQLERLMARLEDTLVKYSELESEKKKLNLRLNDVLETYENMKIKLRTKDELLIQALDDKQTLMAQLGKLPLQQ